MGRWAGGARRGTVFPPAHLAGVGELLAAFAAGRATPSRVLDQLRPRWGNDGPAPGAVLSIIPGSTEAAAESDPALGRRNGAGPGGRAVSP